MVPHVKNELKIQFANRYKIAYKDYDKRMLTGSTAKQSH